MTNKSRGRPPGNPRTRERIAAQARALFLERGYRGTTIRAVAAAADVDQALIGYHFGSKQGLFTESMRLLASPSRGLDRALRGDPAGLPERVLAAVTDLWEDPELAGPLAALIRMAMQDEDVLRVLREYLDREVVTRLAEYLGGRDATERATAMVAVVGGLILTRYLVALPTTVALDVADVHRLLGPAARGALSRQRPRARPPARR